MDDAKPMEFATFEQAIEWMYEVVDDPCIDNERTCYLELPDQVEAYKVAQKNGCCGSFDTDVLINGLPARVGCNYGH